ncbi:MAG: hypothetical protein KDB63_03830 [Nocardioidaceae bacterium]|nr:hypothetical protein [Nocardioidaceae bacterium]
MTLVWGAVIAVVAMLFRRDSRSAETVSRVPPPPTAEMLLGERFALGEIASEEYQLRLEVLRNGHGSPTVPGAGDRGPTTAGGAAT